MNWLALLSGIISIVASLTSWLKDRQSIDAGRAEAISEGLQNALKAITQANAIRATVDALPPDKLRSDPGVIYRD